MLRLSRTRCTVSASRHCIANSQATRANSKAERSGVEGEVAAGLRRGRGDEGRMEILRGDDELRPAAPAELHGKTVLVIVGGNAVAPLPDSHTPARTEVKP